MGTARETPRSIRHARNGAMAMPRGYTLAWAHRKSAMHEVIKVVKSHTQNLRKLRIKVARTTLMQSPVILLLMRVLTPRPHTGGLSQGPISPQMPKVMVPSRSQEPLEPSRAQFRHPKTHPWVPTDIHSFSAPANDFICSLPVSCFLFFGGHIAPTLLYSIQALFCMHNY